MRYWLGCAVVLLGSLAWADVVQYEAQFSVTDTGVTHLLDIDAEGHAEEYDSLTVCNTGSVAVVCLPSGTIPTYSTTAKFPIPAGECRVFSDRMQRNGKYSRVSCITSAGESTTVGVIAQE